MHGTCANEAQTSGVTHRGSQSPSAAPGHSALDDGVADVKERGDGFLHDYEDFGGCFDEFLRSKIKNNTLSYLFLINFYWKLVLLENGCIFAESFYYEILYFENR